MRPVSAGRSLPLCRLPACSPGLSHGVAVEPRINNCSCFDSSSTPMLAASAVPVPFDAPCENDDLDFQHDQSIVQRIPFVDGGLRFPDFISGHRVHGRVVVLSSEQLDFLLGAGNRSQNGSPVPVRLTGVAGETKRCGHAIDNDCDVERPISCCDHDL